MSGISGVGGYNANLLPWLTQADGSDPDSPSVLSSQAASGTQAAGPDAETAAASAETGGSTDLENQIRSAVLSALQGAESSGNSTDLKDAIYKALVQVLAKSGIDPKTLKKTESAGQSSDSGSATSSEQSSAQAMDPSTSDLVSQMLAALSGVSASYVSQLMPSQDGAQASDDLFSLLSTSQGANPGSTEWPASSFASQNNNQDLLGFLFDSGQ